MVPGCMSAIAARGADGRRTHRRATCCSARSSRRCATMAAAAGATRRARGPSSRGRCPAMSGCYRRAGPVARLSNADLRSLNQYRPRRRTAGSAPRTLCPMAGTRLDVEVMSHAWVLVRPARDAAASWDPPAAPARFSMELPNYTVGRPSPWSVKRSGRSQPWT